MCNLFKKKLKKAQKDRMTVKPEEVKFVTEEDLKKMNIHFYNDGKDVIKNSSEDKNLKDSNK